MTYSDLLPLGSRHIDLTDNDSPDADLLQLGKHHENMLNIAQPSIGLDTPIGYRIPSPLGDIVVRADNDALTGVYFTGQKYFPVLSMPDTLGAAASAEPYVVSQAREEFSAFFAGDLRIFTVPYRATIGTVFQRQVWEQLARIPYGESVSYGEIARRLNLPVGAARAIGSANGRNPISIIVPCHRVIASSGALTGYAGGVDRKDALLRLESGAAHAGARQPAQFALQL